MASKLYGCFGAGDGLWDKLIRFVERSVEHDRYTSVAGRMSTRTEFVDF